MFPWVSKKKVEKWIECVTRPKRKCSQNLLPEGEWKGRKVRADFEKNGEGETKYPELDVTLGGGGERRKAKPTEGGKGEEFKKKNLLGTKKKKKSGM